MYFKFTELKSFLTTAAVQLGVLSSRWTGLGNPVAVVLLLTAVWWNLCLVGERHDGGGSVRSGGVVLGVGETVQVLAGGVNRAVDGTFGGASHAVLLSLIQVVGDASFYTGTEVGFSKAAVVVSTASQKQTLLPL